MKETPTNIEQVLRKIVEKAKWEHARVVWNGGSVRPSNSTDSIVHALLNSEEIVILDCVGDKKPQGKDALREAGE